MHTLASLTILAMAYGASAQQMTGGCLRLLGSVACPGFEYAYLSPANLSNAFPFFSTVTDVNSFDVGALNYFSNPDQFETTKFTKELGCSNASTAVIRWERTVLCSMWVNEEWSINCLANYNGTSAATSQKMVCQETCMQYSASEAQITNNTDFCPGPDLTNGNRATTLNKDFVQCTNWTTLATNVSSSCVAGSDNEPNCGFGTSTAQLCDHCSGSNPDSCCYSSSTDVSVCGFALAAPASSSTTSSPASSMSMSMSTGSMSPSPTPSGSYQNDNSSGSGHLHGGKLAGTIVGSVLGGLLLLALLAAALIFARRRRRRDPNNRDSASSFGGTTAAGAGTGAFGGLFGSSNNRSSTAPKNSSEKGLLSTSRSAAAISSPTMGGNDSYDHGSGSPDGPGMLGAPVGAAAGGMMPGERTSGVVLPRVRDENQSGNRWIETGAEVSVLWPYQSALPDELDLRPGMKIRVLRLYDDAWGTAQVISGGEPGEQGKTGAFPIVCVSEGSSLGSSVPSSASSH